MLTRPEAADPAVEELKRRARRRLVGAIVLALAAAVILPMLLESEPKPLGEDVSIQIPPIDNGKFITPLSPARTSNTKAAPDTAGSSAPTPAPAQKPAETTPDSVAGAKSAPAPASPTTTSALTSNAKPAESAPATPSDAAPGTASVPAAPTPDVQASPAPATKSASGAGVAGAVSPAGGFVVQVAAFADAKAAPVLASKLKSAGFPVYVDTVKTQKGPMKRVRTGPYATRESADAALAKLTAAGYRGVVTTK